MNVTDSVFCNKVDKASQKPSWGLSYLFPTHNLSNWELSHWSEQSRHPKDHVETLSIFLGTQSIFLIGMRLFRTLSHCHNHWWLLKSSSSQWLWDYTDIVAIWYIGLTRLWWETPPFIACKMISKFWLFWFQYLHLQPRLDFIIEVILWSKVRNRDKHLELPDLRGASLLWIWIEIGTLATIRLDEWCLLVTNRMYNVFQI